MSVRISVVAPAHNASPFFDAWVESIRAQDYQDMETILVDDGSTDDLPDRAAGAPPFVRYLRQEQRGPSAARNAAIRVAHGELIAFLDLDDLWAPGHLRRCAAALQHSPDAAIAQGLIRNITGGFYCSNPYRFINLGAGVFRRSVFDRCGLFDENLRFAEDFDFMTRCWENGVRKMNVDEVSLLYHRHDGNMTKGLSTVDLGAVQVYKRRLERMRAGRVNPELARGLKLGFPQYIGQTIIPHDQGLREPI
jgi:glycosyltransferase involved in cell wall biosynthesis